METLKKEITGKEKALENLDGEAREKMKKRFRKRRIIDLKLRRIF